MPLRLVIALLAAGPNPHLRAAKVFYDEFQFSRCVQQLEQAARAPATGPELVEIELYGGLCRYNLGDFKGSDEHFRIALRLDPEVALPPLTSPKISERFEQARLAARPPPDAPTLTPPAPPAAPEPAPQPLLPAPAQEPAPASAKAGPLPFLLGGGGVASAGAGLLLGVRAKTLAAQASAEPLDLPSAQLAQQARGTAAAANVGYAVGAGLAVAAVIVYLLETR